MNFQEFKSIVERNGPVQRDGKDWRGRCPAHEDTGTRGDLAFCEEDGKLLVKCWGGCGTETVLGALGLTMKDLFGTNGNGKHAPRRERRKTPYPGIDAAVEAIGKRLRGRPSGQWTYQNTDGSEALVVLRFDGCAPADEKTYRPIHPSGTGYAEGDPPGSLPLFGLPELLQDATGTVFLVEGEKCVDAARSIGLLATTSAHGAGSVRKTDWQPLAGRDVVILPDNDSAGQMYAETVRDILLDLDPRARVRLVRLPDLPEGGDIHDWLEQCDAVEPETLQTRIMFLADQAEPERRGKPQDRATGEKAARGIMQPDYICMKDVSAKPVEWLWPHRIPRGMLSLIVGIEGKGKTFVVLDMAARITTGRAWPDGGDAPEIGNVVIATSEDSLEYTIRPRLDAMGADPARVFAFKGVSTDKWQCAVRRDSAWRRVRGTYEAGQAGPRDPRPADGLPGAHRPAQERRGPTGSRPVHYSRRRIRLCHRRDQPLVQRQQQTGHPSNHWFCGLQRNRPCGLAGQRRWTGQGSPCVCPGEIQPASDAKEPGFPNSRCGRRMGRRAVRLWGR